MKNSRDSFKFDTRSGPNYGQSVREASATRSGRTAIDCNHCAASSGIAMRGPRCTRNARWKSKQIDIANMSITRGDSFLFHFGARSLVFENRVQMHASACKCMASLCDCIRGASKRQYALSSPVISYTARASTVASKYPLRNNSLNIAVYPPSLRPFAFRARVLTGCINP